MQNLTDSKGAPDSQQRPRTAKERRRGGPNFNPSRAEAFEALIDLWDDYVECREEELTTDAIERIRKPLIRLARGYD